MAGRLDLGITMKKARGKAGSVNVSMVNLFISSLNYLTYLNRQFLKKTSKDGCVNLQLLREKDEW